MGAACARYVCDQHCQSVIDVHPPSVAAPATDAAGHTVFTEVVPAKDAHVQWMSDFLAVSAIQWG